MRVRIFAFEFSMPAFPETSPGTLAPGIGEAGTGEAGTGEPVRVRGPVREFTCPVCLYPIPPEIGAICPECGHPITADDLLAIPERAAFLKLADMFAIGC